MTCRSSLRLFLWLAAILIPFSGLQAQGFLPPPTASTGTVATAKNPLLIGDPVPETLPVTEENGKSRTLMSYKSPVEILVIEFVDVQCPAAHWHDLSRFYQRYKDWRVSFVAVNSGPAASTQELDQAMKVNDLPYPILKLGSQDLIREFGIHHVPAMVIVDESAYVRYRGPIGKPATDAIDAVIGHIDKVPDAEPSVADGCAIP